MTKLSAIRSSPQVIDGSAASADLKLDADVCVIGSGAGGAHSAAVLAQAGFSVLLVEEGGYYTHQDFDMHETSSAPHLYQEGMTRTTADAAITVFQGRAVGGTTVVNWTTSFRTPESVVQHWRDKHAVRGFNYADLIPHYQAVEERLSIAAVTVESMNRNNRSLYDGCQKLGWQVEPLRRNVWACMQTGMCHLGCPVNAKRSMLVTLIPDAIDAGARLLFRARAERLEVSAGAISGVQGRLLDAEGRSPSGHEFSVRAKVFVVSGGAINSPALLLRSGIDDEGRVGARTFLHPVIASAAQYEEPVEAWHGAPQSAASHHFAERGTEIGFFLEAVPWYPGLVAAAVPGRGADHAAFMGLTRFVATHIALTIDGLHEDVPGGRVRLRPSGAPILDYPLVDKQWAAFRFAQKRLAEEQLASGAKRVTTLHDPPVILEGKLDEAAIDGARWQPGSVAVFTAHQMGGCAMGDEPKSSVVRSEDLRHHRLKNLYVIDGSVFPTSLGVNPQESIYGLSRLMSTRLAAVLPRT
ncbi:MAG: GMC family oxidoreductase [Myxococcota bacterium]